MILQRVARRPTAAAFPTIRQRIFQSSCKMTSRGVATAPPSEATPNGTTFVVHRCVVDKTSTSNPNHATTTTTAATSATTTTTTTTAAATTSTSTASASSNASTPSAATSSISAGMARVGELRGRRGLTVKTPAVLLDSLGISTAFLTPDLTEKLGEPVVSTVHLGNAFSVQGLLQSNKQSTRPEKRELGDVFGLHKQSLVFLTPRPDVASGIFGAPLDQPASGQDYAFETVHGRKRVGVDEYLSLVMDCRPDLFAVLAQEPPVTAAAKKHDVAARQNAEWLARTCALLNGSPQAAVAEPSTSKAETSVGGSSSRNGDGEQHNAAKHASNSDEAALGSATVAAWKAIIAQAPAAGAANAGGGTGEAKPSRKRKLGKSDFTPGLVAALRAQAAREQAFLKDLGCIGRQATRRMRQRLMQQVRSGTASPTTEVADHGPQAANSAAETTRALDVQAFAKFGTEAAALAVVTGGQDLTQWKENARRAAASSVKGFILGFNSGASADGSGDAFGGESGRALHRDILREVGPLLAHGNKKRVVLAQGAARSPTMVLTMVAHGIDLVDCPLPVDCTRAHRALVFPLLHDGAALGRSKANSAGDSEPSSEFLAQMDAFTEAQEAEEYSLVKPSTQNDSSAPSEAGESDWQDALFAEGPSKEGGSAATAEDLFGNSSQGPGPRISMDLFDKSFEVDQQPLVIGCECHACRNHTRAYIYHLLNCKESLAFILLHIHNTHHMHTFMRGVRESLLSGADAASSAESASFWELYQSYSQLRFQDDSDPILSQTK